MKRRKVVIVGAGTGGLSVARELSKNQNVNIKIIEKTNKYRILTTV